MKVLVTGGSGFIGTSVVENFLANGASVLNFDIAPPRNPKHAPHWQKGDVRSFRSIESCILEFRPDNIIHLAARTDLDGKSVEDYSANTDGVRHLVLAANSAKTVKQVIFASSRLVCEIGYTPKHDEDYRPSTYYGESKVVGEQIVRSMLPEVGFHATIVRPTSIWGPWFDIPYKTFFLSIARNRYIHPKGRSIPKSFGFVLNTVHQLRAILDADWTTVHGRTFYLADYPPIEVKVFADSIQEAIGTTPVRSISPGLLRMAARAGDVAKLCGWKNPPLTSFRLNNLLTPMTYDLSPLEEVAGKLPYTMHDGVRLTVDWLRSAGEIK